jgi:DNA polymerase-3 subunit alpha
VVRRSGLRWPDRPVRRAPGRCRRGLLNGNFDLAGERAKAWEAIFPGAFYLEVQRYGQPQQEAIVQQTADLAGDTGIPLVATHPIQFMNPDDFQAHEARVCIAEGYVLGDTGRPRVYGREQYFKTQDEMAELFADRALENTLEIAKRCNIEMTLGKNFLPSSRRRTA